MHQIKNEIIIFSVYQGGESSEVNKANHEKTYQRFKANGVSVKELLGVYEGVEEQSFLVLSKHEEVVKSLCADYNQECYLKSYSDRTSELVFNDGKVKPIGTLKPISKYEAAKRGSYTVDTINDTYWATA